MKINKVIELVQRDNDILILVMGDFNVPMVIYIARLHSYMYNTVRSHQNKTLNLELSNLLNITFAPAITISLDNPINIIYLSKSIRL